MLVRVCVYRCVHCMGVSVCMGVRGERGCMNFLNVLITSCFFRHWQVKDDFLLKSTFSMNV